MKKVGSLGYKDVEQLTDIERMIVGEEAVEKFVDEVYWMVCTDDEVLHERTPFYINELPYVYIGNPFRYNFIGEKDRVMGKEIVVPFFASCMDVQQFQNSVFSQLADQVSKKTERSVLYSEESMTPTQIENIKNLNKTPSAFAYKGYDNKGNANQPPMVLEPAQIDQSLLPLMQMSKVLIDQQAGYNFANDGGKDEESGVAVGLKIAQNDLVQQNLMSTFLNAFTRVGELIKAMMVNTVRQDRNISIGDKLQSVNKKRFEAIHKNYRFEIAASVTSSIAKARDFQKMVTFMQLAQSAQPLILDKVVESMDLSNGDILSRRLRSQVPVNIAELGDGKMDFAAYYKNLAAIDKQENQMKQQEMQMKQKMMQKELEIKQAEALAKENKVANDLYIQQQEIQIKKKDKLFVALEGIMHKYKVSPEEIAREFEKLKGPMGMDKEKGGRVKKEQINEGMSDGGSKDSTA
jgi:hypothetical protein